MVEVKAIKAHQDKSSTLSQQLKREKNNMCVFL